MNAADDVLDRIAAWAKSRDEGRELTAEELCQGRPELLCEVRSGIARLKQMQWLHAGGTTADYVPAAWRAPAIEDGDELLPAESGEVPLAEFRRRLLESGLIAPALLADLERELAAGKAIASPAALAGALVAQQQLTRHQVREIARGRGHLLTLGNYVILDQLGRGGMGQVYRARHQRMDRLVALKVIREQSVDSPEAIQRFQREVKAAARLSHPNIVRAYDADDARGTHFLVMELVDGVDLHALVSRQAPLAPPAALDCLLQAARGLDYAHQQGIVHRDIKPSNLLIDRQGQVRILDMGLARLTADEHVPPSRGHLTQEGAVLGTVDYMAPEQAAHTRAADARSDIYSLGCTLYFLLAGQPPFGGETLMARLLAHRDEPIPRLRDKCPDAPECLEGIVTRCLAKNPADRFQNVAELIGSAAACRESWTAATADSPLGPSVAAAPANAGSRDTSSILNADTLTRERPPGPPVSPAEPDDPATPHGARHRPNRRLHAAIAAAAGVAALVAAVFAIRAALQPPATPPPAPADDRAVALWALGLGSRVEVIVGEEYFALESAEGLPRDGAVKLQGLDFAFQAPIVDADLARLAGLQSLRSLGCYETPITDDAGPHLARLTTLEQLSLGKTQITDAVLADVARLPNLVRLRLGETNIGDAGLKHLRNCKSLQDLDLRNTQATPAGIAELRKSLPNCRLSGDE